MLISTVLPIMSLYRLPHGQYGYSGHVINLLPRLPRDLDVIVVRKEGAAQSHRDFRVRRSVVLGALQWLIGNNKYYRSVTIESDALALLPEDGNISGLCAVTLDTADEEEQLEAPVAQDDDPFDPHLSGTFIPSVARRMTEQETVRQSVQERQSHQSSATPTVAWPPSGNPISEFTTEGYISCAFPTLFPTGAADFVAPRQHVVTAGYYFKHLMMYHDGHFARHPRFRYFALNTEMRWRALQSGRIYVRQHPNDAHLTVDELRDMVGREGEVFSNRVLHYASSLRGTRHYWFRQRSRLIAMVTPLVCPLCSLPTVQPTSSGLSWPASSALMTPPPVLPAAQQS